MNALRVGRHYRHLKTGKIMEVDQIWVEDNPFEGGLTVKVRMHICDEDQHTACVGLTALERWWPNLQLVEDPSVTMCGADGELPD